MILVFVIFRVQVSQFFGKPVYIIAKILRKQNYFAKSACHFMKSELYLKYEND